MVKTAVSVIIPAYNHELYVQHTIKSIIAQSFRDIELIVIDDGSKDNTSQKINELKSECEKRFVNVHFETKNNERTCKTLNKLLSLAQGEFVYLIASDDIAKPEAVRKEYEFLSTHPNYVLAVGDNEFINGENQRIGWDDAMNPVPLDEAPHKTFREKISVDSLGLDFSSEDFGSYKKLLRNNHVPNGYMIRRSALKDVIFTPDAPLEDLYLMLQLAKRGKFKFIDEILFSYRWHQSNTAAKRSHMLNITWQTYRYEKSLVEAGSDEELKRTFIACTESITPKFNIGNFIKYYRHYGIGFRENILEICGKKFQVKYVPVNADPPPQKRSIK